MQTETETRTDAELIVFIADGDATALSSLHHRYGRLVLRISWQVLRNRADAEEVLQDVFMQVWQQAARFNRARGGVSTWLGMMARTRSIDRLRRLHRITSAPDPLMGPAIDEYAAPETAAAETFEPSLRRAIHALPCSQRIALELWMNKGLTHAQIAEVLGQPLGTIKTRMRLSLGKLREVFTIGAVGREKSQTWPFAASPTEYFIARFQSPARKELTGIRVLLVDADAESNELVRAVLESAGAQVTDARCWSHALKRLPECGPDILLTEIRMPGGDGITLLRAASALAAESERPLITATFSSRVAPRWIGLTTGSFAGHVTKPIDPRALVEAVERLAGPRRGHRL